MIGRVGRLVVTRVGLVVRIGIGVGWLVMSGRGCRGEGRGIDGSS